MQRGAFTKSMVAYSSYTLRNIDTSQRGAPPKSVISYRGYTIRNNNTSQRGAPRKGVISYRGYTIRNNNFFFNIFLIYDLTNSFSFIAKNKYIIFIRIYIFVIFISFFLLLHPLFFIKLFLIHLVSLIEQIIHIIITVGKAVFNHIIFKTHSNIIYLMNHKFILISLFITINLLVITFLIN